MKKSILIPVLVVVLFITGFFFFQENLRENREENIYVLYDPAKDEKLNWSKFEHLFPADFDPPRANFEIEERLKINERQKELYDSIQDHYYSQLRLRKGEQETAFYLELNPHMSILFEQTDPANAISENEISTFNVISLDSMVNIIPGLEYYQLKNGNKVQSFDNLSFQIIEKVQESDMAIIHRVRPVVEEYD